MTTSIGQTYTNESQAKEGVTSDSGFNSRLAHVIINPLSAGGRTGQRLQSILDRLMRVFGNHFSVSVTQSPGEAQGIAQKAILDGCELIIAIGGDGTIQEVVNGFFSNGKPIPSRCQLGIISSGTGQGFAQSLNLPSKIESQLEVIRDGQSQQIDVGKVTYFDNQRRQVERFFVNELQAGIGASVVNSVNDKKKTFGGTLAFGVTALSQALKYQALFIHLTLDDTFEISRPLIGVEIANGAYTGGGMNLAPQAKSDDGLLDVLAIHDQATFERLWNFPKIYSGGHISTEKFSYHKARRIRIDSPLDVPLAADGEVLGRLPCVVNVLHKAIQVLTPTGLKNKK